MYQGNNPVAIRSINGICDELIALLKDNEWKKISIGLLCENVGLSRQTFYNFFKEKEDVLRYRLRQVYEKEYDTFYKQGEYTFKIAVSAVKVTLRKNGDLLRLMEKRGLENVIVDEVCRAVNMFAWPFYHDAQQKKDVEYSIAFLSGAMSRIFLCWIKDPDPYSEDKFCDLIYYLLTGSYSEVAKFIRDPDPSLDSKKN